MQFRRPKLRLLICSLLISVGVVLVTAGFLTAVTGREAQDLPDAIESVEPIRDSVRVPAQTRVFVDLLAGYTGVLIIDGVELPTVELDELNAQAQPGQQITLPPTAIFEPGNATITFTPNEDAPIERFEQGRHRATVVFWKVIDGRDTARSYSWEFNVF